MSKIAAVCPLCDEWNAKYVQSKKEKKVSQAAKTPAPFYKSKYSSLKMSACHLTPKIECLKKYFLFLRQTGPILGTFKVSI